MCLLKHHIWEGKSYVPDKLLLFEIFSGGIFFGGGDHSLENLKSLIKSKNSLALGLFGFCL